MVEVLPQANHPDPSLASEPLKQESYQLQGLEEYHEYSITVRQVNAAGSSQPTPPVMQNMPGAGM